MLQGASHGRRFLFQLCAVEAHERELFQVVLAIPEEWMTFSALLQIMRRITWSCNHARYGVWPVQGASGENLVGNAGRKAGRPLTMRPRFQVTQIRGDSRPGVPSYAWVE